MDDSWLAWEGAEVEGSWFGIRTLFLRRWPGLAPFPTDLLARYEHVYFRSSWVAEHGVWLVKDALATGAMVTVEVVDAQLLQVPEPLRAATRIMLVLHQPHLAWLGLLKPDDVVRLDLADALNVTVLYKHLHWATPVDYANDVRVL